MNIKKILNYETISYIIFGVLTTAVDWLVYTVLRLSGNEYMLCTVASWITSVLFAYITNKWIVFKSRSLNPVIIFKEFVAFIVARLATGAINIGGMWMMVTIFKENDFIAKAVLSVVVVILNYAFSKIFIFKK